MLLAGAAENSRAVPGPPGLLWAWPFAAILLAIALLPLLRGTHHWWERNRHKLLVSLVLAAVTLLYYGLRGYGITRHDPTHAAGSPTGSASQTAAAEGGAHAEPGTRPGWPTVTAVLRHAVLAEYVPFMVLLFSLYVIAGGIVVRGDIRATPLVNTTLLAIGAGLASLIGTTGAAMVLIRLVLKTNAERRRKVHTIVFFIFLVANVGGLLLPIGDPPLFLGYLRGVDFFWTLQLWRQWLFMIVTLLVIYFAWDVWAYRHEAPEDLRLDRTQIQPVRIVGLVNLLWLLGVVVAVATLDPSKPLPGLERHAPAYLREAVQLLMAALSLMTTARVLRKENEFNYAAIGEVACLFIGIFITMQVPIEILQAVGPQMAEAGFARAWQFFWASGVLSSFLDNAPTYVVYFETAGTLAPPGMELMRGVHTASGSVPIPLLVAVSCGAVFMGANTYIGNGPNFMVKAIAEQSGVRMPSFFGYMLYSMGVLFPLFIALTLVFFRT